MRKTSAHGISMQKNPQNGEKIFWISTHFHGVMRVQLAPLHGNLMNGVANSEIVYYNQWMKFFYFEKFQRKNAKKQFQFLITNIFKWITNFFCK